MDCSVQSLMTNANGVECCIRGRRQIMAVKIWLLATIAGTTTDPAALRELAKCLDDCLPPGTILGINVYLLTVISSSSTSDPQTLANNARCFRQPCVTSTMRAAMQIWILTQIAGVSADPTFLLNSAKCIMECMPVGSMLAVEAYLLCQIAGV